MNFILKKLIYLKKKLRIYYFNLNHILLLFQNRLFFLLTLITDLLFLIYQDLLYKLFSFLFLLLFFLILNLFYIPLFQLKYLFIFLILINVLFLVLWESKVIYFNFYHNLILIFYFIFFYLQNTKEKFLNYTFLKNHKFNFINYLLLKVLHQFQNFYSKKFHINLNQVLDLIHFFLKKVK